MKKGIRGHDIRASGVEEISLVAKERCIEYLQFVLEKSVDGFRTGDFSYEYAEKIKKQLGDANIAILGSYINPSNPDNEGLKVIQAFIMTMPGIPLIYYGEEIGMKYIPDMRSVEGAYKRTGSRTPMQWNNEKNYGFSVADKLYIEQDKSESAPTVENQEKDENSLLNHMKKMIALRKAHPSLQEDGELKIISNGYPAIYERSIDGEVVKVMINPSDRECIVEEKCIQEVLAQMNIQINKCDVRMCGCGYLIYK